MIAEIKGKVSSTNANLNERLEDELTGNFFGNLRYMSFNRGLKRILIESIFPVELSKELKMINVDNWNNNIEFWPKEKECEIDVRMNFESIVIGVEVKFRSQLSSDDDSDLLVLVSDDYESDAIEKLIDKELDFLEYICRRKCSI